MNDRIRIANDYGDVRLTGKKWSELQGEHGLKQTFWNYQITVEEILNEGKAERAGAHPSNLSPYATVVQYLFTAEREKVLSLLSAEEGPRRVLIPDEIELPADIDRAQLRNAVFVAAGAARVNGLPGDE